MSVSSDEINYLVYRYLQESGFTHSAFTFAHESLVARSVVADADVPPGALISFMQKGLQYVEIESHLQEDGSERQCDEPFFLLAPHVCRVKSLYSAGGKGRGGGELSSGWEGSGTANGGGVGGPGGSIEVPPSDVTLLVGHKREVFVAAFHPTADILATGSGDGTARLWRLDAAAGGGDPPCTVLQHSTTGGDGRKGGGAGGKDKTQDVAALDWSPDGSRLATGMYDGRARIWSLDGALQSVLTGHTSAVFSIQWSPAGQFVLTGSADKSAIVWDATTGLPAQQFSHHTGPVLDVDWASETTFATASSDKTVSVCTLGAGGGGNSNSNSGNGSPLRSFVGHTDEVNAIQWNPAKSILASASDDGTARLWSLSSSSSGSGGSGTGGDGCVGVLAGHKKAVYSAKWAPTGEGSRNPGKAPLLATASFDATVRLWDPSTVQCVATLARHTAMVYSVAFSPDGEYLASGSSDRNVLIWSARDGSLVRSFTAPAGVFEVAWSASGDSLAAACANAAVSVLHLRR